MNDFAAMQISSAGMNAQRARIRVIAENLANQHTTGPDGPYQRKEVLLRSVPLIDFQSQLDSAISEILTPEELIAIESVAVGSIQSDGSEPILRRLPSHPDADENGDVAFPNVNIMREMTDMMEASRSYEANLAAAKTTKDMLSRVMELLG